MVVNQQHDGHAAPLRFVEDDDVAAVIEAAAEAAWAELDHLFPAAHAVGVTSAFVDALQAAIRKMLAGHMNVNAGSELPRLPVLALDKRTFFGPRISGHAFLVTVAGHLVLAPGRVTVCLPEQAPNAWVSFDDAADAARAYLLAQGSSMPEAIRFCMRVEAVEPAETGGYRLSRHQG